MLEPSLRQRLSAQKEPCFPLSGPRNAYPEFNQDDDDDYSPLVIGYFYSKVVVSVTDSCAIWSSFIIFCLQKHHVE